MALFLCEFSHESPNLFLTGSPSDNRNTRMVVLQYGSMSGSEESRHYHMIFHSRGKWNPNSQFQSLSGSAATLLQLICNLDCIWILSWSELGYNLIYFSLRRPFRPSRRWLRSGDSIDTTKFTLKTCNVKNQCGCNSFCT